MNVNNKNIKQYNNQHGRMPKRSLLLSVVLLMKNNGAMSVFYICITYTINNSIIKVEFMLILRQYSSS